jgi:hypothetical protein
MSADSQIIQDVLKLPRAERSFLAKKLLESLETDAGFHQTEIQEFDQRSGEIRAGIVEPMTLDELQTQVSAQLA